MRKLNIFAVSLFTLISAVITYAEESVDSVKIGSINAVSYGGSTFIDLLLKWLANLGWILVGSIGFAIGISIAFKIFNLFSGTIDEWEELKKGNIGIAIIFVAMIVMIGLIVLKVI